MGPALSPPEGLILLSLPLSTEDSPGAHEQEEELHHRAAVPLTVRMTMREAVRALCPDDRSPVSEHCDH